MRALGWLSLASSTLALLLGNTPCTSATPDGTSAGTFGVTETLTSNACTGGFDPDPVLQYTTEIRIQGDISYWRRGDTPIASGTYSASTGRFHFVAQQDVPAYAGSGGAPGCTLRQTQTLDGTLVRLDSDGGAPSDAGAADAGPDAGIASAGFDGTDTIQLSITPGSDCSALFASNGGPFSMLPCSAVYDMTALVR